MNAKKHPGEPNFAGTISDTYQTSTPAWPDLPQGLGGATVRALQSMLAEMTKQAQAIAILDGQIKAKRNGQ